MLISVGILKFCKLIHFLSEVGKGGERAVYNLIQQH